MIVGKILIRVLHHHQSFEEPESGGKLKISLITQMTSTKAQSLRYVPKNQSGQGRR